MSIFNRNKSANSRASQAEMVLRNIHDGVIIADDSGVVQFINPAAVRMISCGSADKATGLDYGLVVKIESKEGRELSEAENPLVQAMRTGQPLDNYQACIIMWQTGQRLPVSISVLPADGKNQHRIITFRDITKELAEEGEQTEFISTASHEMRTPVATIDGYISLTLNPQTATIDERARGYLNAAHAASQHLGLLFRNLLDITKLDDGKIRPHFEPVDMVPLVRSIAQSYLPRARDAKLNFKFGTEDDASFGLGRRMEQPVFGYVDINFMHEILDNLIENALKYTPSGGAIYVNVRGDGDKALINVTDTGIGISAEDLSHIFQKFYRADNSDTRTIGGTGLGLYIVKQRAEAMGGKVWAESSFGEGSTFYVSLPRITNDEYNKRMIAFKNQSSQQPTQVSQLQAVPQPQSVNAALQASQPQPRPQPVQPAQPIPQPAPQAPQSTQAPTQPIIAHPQSATPILPAQAQPRPAAPSSAQYVQPLQPRAPTAQPPYAPNNININKGVNQ